MTNFGCENCLRHDENCTFTASFKKRGRKSKKKQINTSIDFPFIHSDRQSHHSLKPTQMHLPTKKNFINFDKQETQRQNFHQQSQLTTSPVIKPAQQTYTLPNTEFDDSSFMSLLRKMSLEQVKKVLSVLIERCEISLNILEEKRDILNQEKNYQSPLYLLQFGFDDSRFKAMIEKLLVEDIKETLSILERRCNILKQALNQEQVYHLPKPIHTMPHIGLNSVAYLEPDPLLDFPFMLELAQAQLPTENNINFPCIHSDKEIQRQNFNQQSQFITSVVRPTQQTNTRTLPNVEFDNSKVKELLRKMSLEQVKEYLFCLVKRCEILFFHILEMRDTSKQENYYYFLVHLPQIGFDDSRFKAMIGKFSIGDVKEALSALERRCDLLKQSLNRPANFFSEQDLLNRCPMDFFSEQILPL
ncbi:hypothetical protein F8M41_010822 [Gigaspora margarita]|uniref:Uncharacterized protein n=4 Tax=Gigaspora margarita TaxID=4874 RepID=A0A8H4A0R0_GIGMA|nr:hypothetical protein F8M41_010822 [Gigaspora margarita]